MPPLTVLKYPMTFIAVHRRNLRGGPRGPLASSFPFERYAADSELGASAFLENVILFLNLIVENVREIDCGWKQR